MLNQVRVRLNRQYATELYFVYLLKIKYGWNFWPKVSFIMIKYNKEVFLESNISDELILLHKSEDFSPKIQIW